MKQKVARGGLCNMKYASPVQQRDGVEDSFSFRWSCPSPTLAGKGTLCLETGSSQNSTCVPASSTFLFILSSPWLLALRFLPKFPAFIAYIHHQSPKYPFIACPPGWAIGLFGLTHKCFPQLVTTQLHTLCDVANPDHTGKAGLLSAQRSSNWMNTT